VTSLVPIREFGTGTATLFGAYSIQLESRWWLFLQEAAKALAEARTIQGQHGQFEAAFSTVEARLAALRKLPTAKSISAKIEAVAKAVEERIKKKKSPTPSCKRASPNSPKTRLNRPTPSTSAKPEKRSNAPKWRSPISNSGPA
jgi:hypothetical protein